MIHHRPGPADAVVFQLEARIVRVETVHPRGPDSFPRTEVTIRTTEGDLNVVITPEYAGALGDITHYNHEAEVVVTIRRRR